MAAQPLNTAIKIYRNIRSQRAAHRYESVAALTKGLRPQIMSIPGEENLVGVLTRDSTVSDFSPYMGQAAKGNRGFPVVVGLIPQVSFANAQGNIADVDFSFTIGQDQFLTNTVDGLDNDLHADARDLTADV